MLLERIRFELEAMSRVERKIAEVLLSDPAAFRQMSVAEAARAAQVSQGSVNNFAKRYANGFSALKMQLALEEGKFADAAALGQVSGESSISGIMRDSLDVIQATFRHTISENPEEKLAHAARRMMTARRIMVCGIFGSGIVAQALCHELILLGLPAEYCTDVLMCPVIAARLDEQSLVIAVSSSGNTKDIYDTLSIARERGVPCVCITSNPHGTITALCETALIVSSGSASGERRASLIRLSEYFLIDALCTHIRSRTADEATEWRSRQAEIIESHSMEE